MTELTIGSCPQGHLYSPENSAWYENAYGVKRRSCRDCNRLKSRAKWEKKKKWESFKYRTNNT